MTRFSVWAAAQKKTSSYHICSRRWDQTAAALPGLRRPRRHPVRPPRGPPTYRWSLKQKVVNVTLILQDAVDTGTSIWSTVVSNNHLGSSLPRVLCWRWPPRPLTVHWWWVWRSSPAKECWSTALGLRRINMLLDYFTFPHIYLFTVLTFGRLWPRTDAVLRAVDLLSFNHDVLETFVISVEAVLQQFAQRHRAAGIQIHTELHKKVMFLGLTILTKNIGCNDNLNFLFFFFNKWASDKL